MADPGPDVAYWSHSAAGVAALLKAAPSGLTGAEAAARLVRFGPKHIEETQSTGALRLLARQFESPLVLILIFGGSVSLVLGQWVDAGIILTIVSAARCSASARNTVRPPPSPR